MDKKNSKKKKEFDIVNEPVIEYQRASQVIEENYDIPSTLIVSALDSAKLSIKNGNIFTNEQIADFIDKEMGWK